MRLPPLRRPRRLHGATAAAVAVVPAVLLAAAVPLRSARAQAAGSHASPAVAPAVVPARPERPFEVRVVGQGPPVVLVPGLMSHGAVWDATVERLAPRHEVHVLTLAGFAGVPAQPGPDLLGRARDGLVAYLRERRLARPVLVGHSLGGFLAYAVASAAPDAVGGIVAVDGVPFLPALGDTSATAERARPQAEAMRATFAALGPEQVAVRTRAGLPALLRDTSYAERLVGWARASDPATVGQAMAELLTTDLRPRLAALRVPVLQLVAGGAFPTPAAREAMTARYAAQLTAVPRHAVRSVDGAYHFIMLDDPRTFHALLDDFLVRIAADGARPAPAAPGVAP